MTTLYDISLGITYTYENAAAASRNLLRVLPRTLPGQQLISGLVSAEPHPDFRRDTFDFFGNATTELGYDALQTELHFRFTGRVRRTVGPPEFDLSPRLDRLGHEIASAMSLDPLAPHHFTGPSDRVRPEGEITAYAQSATDPFASALSTVRALASAIHRDMSFDPTATEVATPTIDAFQQRRGVCQDFSHVMIAALRGLGVPAGSVSGFLRTIPPEGQERLEGADAMQAWVQAWCGTEMGWVQIDPTNDILVGTDHIVVALGRDYSDVAPVKGAIRATGAHTTSHEVDVVPIEIT
jgi:transglutaminase-like putative cysteine protease